MTNGQSGQSQEPDTTEEDNFHTAFFNNIVNDYVNPEFERRREERTWDDGRELKAFQVLFNGPLESDRLEIRLNDECNIAARVENKSAKLGTSVKVSLDALQDEGARLQLHPNKDVNSAQISAIKIQGRWVFAFDFNYDTERKKQAL